MEKQLLDLNDSPSLTIETLMDKNAFIRKMFDIDIIYYRLFLTALGSRSQYLEGIHILKFSQLQEINELCNIHTSISAAVEAYVKRYVKELAEHNGITDRSNLVRFGLDDDVIMSIAYASLIKDSTEFLLKQFTFTLNSFDKFKEYAEKDNNFLLVWKDGKPDKCCRLARYLTIQNIRMNKAVIQYIIPLSKNIGSKCFNNVGLHKTHRTLYPDIKWGELGGKLLKELGLVEELNCKGIYTSDNISSLLGNFGILLTILKDIIKDYREFLAKEYIVPKNIITEHVDTIYSNDDIMNCMDTIDYDICKTVDNLQFLSRNINIVDFTCDKRFRYNYDEIVKSFSYISKIFTLISKLLTIISIDNNKMHSDINNHPEIILSFIKEYLKFVNMKDPHIMIDYYYSTNTSHTLEGIYSFIDKLCIGDDHKKYLKTIDQYSMAE